MTPDRYAVFGNPIGHSRSPFIHAEFARQTGQNLQYDAVLAPLEGFASAVERFRASGGRGANVTVPFKLDAFALADVRTPRAEAAGAANTLSFSAAGITADNTDGIGLVRDLSHLHCPLEEQRILLLGAGGAARGAVLPLLEAGPSWLVIANRTPEKAQTLARRFAAHSGDAMLEGCGLDELTGRTFDVIINATSASLADEVPPLPSGIYAPTAWAYDMMYAATETPFLRAARKKGATRWADGLGMLVEQAAESFFLWRGVRPDTVPVRAALRDALWAG